MRAPETCPVRVPPKHVDHLVVGAGFAGVTAAIVLGHAGEACWLVDRGPDLGGTWRDNIYPGAACDVPSQLYSLSFASNPHWERAYATQGEIWNYLSDVADRYDVRSRASFGMEVTSCRWDDADAHWVTAMTDSGGGEHLVRSRTLILGTGGLSEPRMPDIPGLADFDGPVVHSAKWDGGLEVAGRKVAVIGTGASAIQIVPELQRVAERLDVYQRTPPWVLPRGDRVYGPTERRLLANLPALRKLYRAGIYFGHELYVPALTGHHGLSKPAQAKALKQLRDQVRDTDLRRRLTPDYDIGCKRVLLSDDYYPAITAANVTLVTDLIVRIAPGGPVTGHDEVETQRDAEVLVVATGFHTTEHPMAARVRGRTGLSLAETWSAGGMAAYKGTTVTGFPNLFQLVGPNTALGHSSMLVIIEAQVGYIVDALKTMRREQVAVIEPTETAQRDWNADLTARLARSVWNTGGCSSWYLDAQGRNTTLWPRTTLAFRRLLGRFDPGAYRAERVVRGEKVPPS